MHRLDQGFLRQTQNLGIKVKLVANTQVAVDGGVFGILTFYVGEEITAWS